jgi:hypothetical protein
MTDHDKKPGQIEDKKLSKHVMLKQEMDSYIIIICAHIFFVNRKWMD